MDVRVKPQRRLSSKNWCCRTVMLMTLDSPLDCKEFKPVTPKGNQFLNIHWKDWCWSWNSSTLATACKELTHWKRPWCWEGLGAGGEGGDRGWEGWMASPTPWTWVWVNFRSLWWTGRPGVLRFMGSQRVGHDWATELTDWLTDWNAWAVQGSREVITIVIQILASFASFNLVHSMVLSWILLSLLYRSKYQDPKN